MAVYQVDAYSSLVQYSLPVDAVVVSNDVVDPGTINPLTLIEAIEDKMTRSQLSFERVASSEDRVRQPLVRFSIQEIIDILDYAAVEVLTNVRSEYLTSFQEIKTPSSGVFNLADTIRLLGTTVKVNDNLAFRLGVYQFEDTLSRGITPSDSEPMYIHPSANVEVHADTVNPTDSQATFISLPVEITRTSSGSFDPNTNTLTTDDDIFTTSETGLVVYLSDSTNEGYGWIETVSDDNEVVVRHTGTLTPITTPTTVRLIVPIVSQLSTVLQSLVIELAAADMFAAMGEIGLMETCLKDYARLLQRYRLAYFPLKDPERS